MIVGFCCVTAWVLSVWAVRPCPCSLPPEHVMVSVQILEIIVVLKFFIGFFCVAFCVVGFPQSAFAQSVVFGSGDAQICYMHVKTGDPGRAATIRVCEKALKGSELSKKDTAATYVNLGILHMRAKDNEQAQKAFNAAINLRPTLAESHINHAASLIYTGDYHGALKAVNTGIDLGTNKMPEALFNRAVAYDYLRRYDEAYADLKNALALRPNWPPALRAIGNYDVTPVQSN